MRFLRGFYVFSPVIAALTLLTVLSFCATYSSLNRRGAKRAELAALGAAWAIGLLVPMVYSIVDGHPSAAELIEALLPMSIAVLLPLIVAAPLYRRFAPKSAAVGVGLAAIAAIAVSPFCALPWLFASCLARLGCLRL